MDFELKLEKPALNRAWISALVMGLSYFLGKSICFTGGRKSELTVGECRWIGSYAALLLPQQHSTRSVHIHWHHGRCPAHLWIRQGKCDQLPEENMLVQCIPDAARWGVSSGHELCHRPRRRLSKTRQGLKGQASILPGGDCLDAGRAGSYEDSTFLINCLVWRRGKYGRKSICQAGERPVFCICASKDRSAAQRFPHRCNNVYPLLCSAW